MLAVALVIRQLRESDVRSTFRSGQSDLDRFFLEFAGQNQFRLHIGATYVAVEDDVIVGFATVASCSIEIKGLPKKLAKGLPRYPMPALRLVRMAVAEGRQRGGVGSELMRAVFLIALDQKRRTGCAFVVVDAKQSAVPFYARFGFEPMSAVAGELEARPTPQPMFLEIGAIPDVDELGPGA